MNNQLINKYGIKKVRFSVSDPTAENEKKVTIIVKLNLHEMTVFDLEIKGQALSMRRKNL